MDPMTIAALASAASNIYSNFAGGGGPQKMRTKSRGQERAINSQLKQARGMERAGGGYSSALDLLKGYLDPNSDIYQNFEAPYMQQFEQQTVPMLAERFAGAGAMGGGLSSSGFGQSLSSAGANLQTNLAQMKSGMQNQAIQSLIQQYNQLISSGTSPDLFAYGIEGGGGGGGTGGGMGGGQGFEQLLNMISSQKAGGGGGGNQQQYPLTNYSGFKPQYY